jgi:hypothetical protein
MIRHALGFASSVAVATALACSVGATNRQCHANEDTEESGLQVEVCERDNPFVVEVTWQELSDAVGYQVSGTVEYARIDCEPRREYTPLGVVEFSERVASDTTTFVLPPPEDGDANFAKEVDVLVQALEDDEHAIAEDGALAIIEPLAECA